MVLQLKREGKKTGMQANKENVMEMEIDAFCALDRKDIIIEFVQ
jgi:hypothetical protein